MKKLIIVLFLILLSTSANAKRLHKERYYQDITCNEIGGIVEYRLPDKTRVDCLTNKHSWEHDFASKWPEAIGQSLHYGRMTKRRAGIYLIMEKRTDEKYYRRLMDNISHYDLPITVRAIQEYENR